MKLSKVSILKAAALVLCAAVLVVTLVGSDFTGDAFVGPGVNITAAMRTFSPDTVMISSGNLAITWEMFYFFLHDIASQITSGFQGETDWAEAGPTGETLSELVIAYASDQAVQVLVYEYGVYLLGVSLSEDELDSIRDYTDMLLSEAGSLDNLEDDLRAGGFFDIAGFEMIMTSLTLQAKLPISLYGESYSDISDDVVARFAEDGGYMLAKHILRAFPYEDEELTPEELEAAKEAAYNEASDLLETLNAHKNDEDFVEFFSALELEHSNDLGSRDFPNGYLFQYYDMVPQFSDACESLDLGQLSGIVESPFGYHIILRLPLDYDNVLSFSQYQQGQGATLRQLAILDDFDGRYNNWLDSMTIEFSPELESLDLADVFAWHD